MRSFSGVLVRGATLVALMAFGISCGGDDADPHPGQLFSGFEEGAGVDFKVPITLSGLESSMTVRWSVADSSMASVATEVPLDGKRATAANTHHAIVTTKKAGKITLKAEADGNTYEIPLTITKYAPGSRQLGNELYQIDRTGSTPEPGSTPSDVKGLGCIGCHGTRGGPGHSPAEIGGFDDAAILRTIATA